MIKGFNAYLDGARVNDTLLLTPSFEFTGLASDTDYSDRVAMTAVDFAGNESAMSGTLPPGTAKTPTRPAGPVAMSPEDRAAVDAIVTASMVESGQPGVLISLTGPRGSYAKAYGNTKASGGRPLTLDDHVRIGSATKAFTAMAVLQAIDDAVLSFDDTLASFAHPTIDITRVPNSEKITVRDLLSMRAGVFDYQADTLIQLVFLINPTATFSAAGAVQAIVNHNAPVFEPGTSYAYSNSNYVLLGLILEVVRGKSIKRILSEDIIAPLGMSETRWPDGSSVQEPAAAQTAANPELFGAAGALTSTIGDLSKWAEALRDHDLISADMYDVWTSWFWDYDTGWSSLRFQSEYIPLKYGYGLGAESIGSWQGHPGGFLVGSSGWGVVPFFDKVSGATIAVAENKATSSPVLAAQTRIFTRIASYLYPDSMFDVSHAPVPKPAADLGLDVVSQAFSGFQSVSGEFVAASGADVFVVVNWDRPAAVSSVSYGGVAMDLLGSVYHNASSANGGVALYHLSGAGTGVGKQIAVSGSGGWVSMYGISFTDVTGLGSVVSVTGSGTALSQSVTNATGTTLQVFSVGAAGAPTYPLGPLSGGRNRGKQFGTNPLLWVNTTTKTGAVAATASGINKWAGLALHIGVAEDQLVRPTGTQITTTGGTPTVKIDTVNKVLTPSPAALHIEGRAPGATPTVLTPAGATVGVTGGQPHVPDPVAFDAVGAGASGSSTTGTTTISWPHTIATDANYALVAVSAYSAAGLTTTTATLGGVPMTQLGMATAANVYGRTFLFGLANPPTGTQTISAVATISKSGGVYPVGSSVSYKNVASIGTAVTGSALSNPASITVAGLAAGDGAFFVFGDGYSSTNMSGFNRTQRYQGSTSSSHVVMGDALNNTGSVAGTVTVASGRQVAGIGVRLVSG